MKKIILLFALFFISICSAQSTAVEWQKCLGGSNNEEAKCIQTTPDGGYIIAGYTSSSNGNVTGLHTNSVLNYSNIDGWVVKLNNDGNIEWQKCIGGSYADYLQSIQLTSDGGYIVVGYTDSNDGDVSGNHSASTIGYGPDHNLIDSTDAWVVKLSSTGAIEWQKCLGGTGIDNANSVQALAQGGYIITGHTTSNDGDVSNHRTIAAAPNNPMNTYDLSEDAWVVKLTNSGAIVWEKCLDTGNIDNVIFNNEYGESIQPTVDGGYIMSGGSRLRGPDNTLYYPVVPWVIKLDSNGNKQWEDINTQCTIDGTYTDIQLTTDGGYIMTGYQCGSVYVLKLNSMGTMLWQKWFGGSSYEGARSIKPTSDGGYILAGETYSNNVDVSGNHGSYDAWIVRLNSVGDLLWQKCLGGTGYDGANSIQTTPDGGYIVAGYNTSTNGDVSGNNGYKDIWVVKLISDLPPTSTGVQNFCQGATVASLVATGTALRWYTAATGGTALATTALLISRTYYVSQTVNGVESLRAPVTVTVNALPTTPGTITGTVAQGALVGTTTTATYSIAPVLGVSSYFWTPPTGAYIVSGQGTTSVAVNFVDVPAGIGAIGNIMVQTVNDSGCKSVAKTLALTKALPTPPATLIMSNGVTATAITSFAKYMGTTTPLKLTAGTVATATSYEWELPEGVNRTDGSGTNSTTPYIFVNFYGVTNANTFNYTTSTGVSTYVLRIGVKAKNGVGVSVSSNTALINPSTLSSAKQLTLTAVRPAAVPAVKGQIAGLCGSRPYNYTITASALASGYAITAPTGAIVTSPNNTNNSLNTLTTADLTFTVTYPSGYTVDATTATADKTLTIAAVNGIGSATSKVLPLTTALAAIGANTNSYYYIVPSTGVGSTSYFTKCAIQTITIPLVLNATSYVWTLQNGATGSSNSNTIDIDFSAVPTLTANTKNIIKVKAFNGCTYSAEKTITLSWNGQTVCGTPKADNPMIISTMSLYPNPTNSQLFIKISNDEVIEKVVVLDLLGKVIFEGKPENNQVDVEGFASGTYILKAFIAEEQFLSKFIKF